MVCPTCASAVAPESVFCPNCGTSLDAACANCGLVNRPGSRFCRSCGSQLHQPTEVVLAPRAEIACPRCHSVNEPDASYCYSCGLPFDEERYQGRAPLLPVGRPAGFLIRAVAAIIDAIVLGLVSVAIVAIWPGVSLTEIVESDGWTWSIMDSVSLIAGAIYHTLAIGIWSTTIGKLAVGIYVLRPSGARVGLVRAFGRHLAGYLSAVILLGGYLMVAFRSDKRGLHDLLCDTVVVFRR